VNAKTLKGQTPLHYAAFYNHFEVAALLIENGARADARNSFDATPLHYAVFNLNVELVKLLLKKGATF
jgi:GA-binding protein transcription factor beta